MRKLGTRLLIVLGFVALSLAFAQGDNPIGVEIEAYIVSQVTGDDGNAQEEFSASTTARPGQVVEYRVTATNNDETTLPPDTVTVNGPIPAASTYVDGSATPSSDSVRTEFTVDGESYSDAPETTEGPSAYRAVRWTILTPLEPGQSEEFVYRVTIN